MRIDLHPARKRKNPPKDIEYFAVADIEAFKWTDFRVIGWYNGEEFHEFRTLWEFFEFCFEQRETTIFCHFGGIYDFLFLIKNAHSHKHYRIESMIPRGSGMLCFDVVKEIGEGKELRISFRDSSALLPFGLANLTKSFRVKHKKQDFNFDTWDGRVTEELLDYLKDDCRGLWESLNEYFNWPLIKKAGPAYTMASQALKVLKLFLLKPIQGLNDTADDFVRQGYFGGRTEIFKPHYNGKRDLYCYDVNSLYPYVMRNNDFPNEFKFFTFNYKPKEMGFYEATVEVPKDMYIPPLPVVETINKTNKLIFPTGKFSGVWSTIELEYAKSLGVKIIKTGRGCLFRNGGPIFREYIDTLYKMRLEAKEKNDGVGDVLTKLLMNSCYGRFGLNKDREHIVFDDFREGLCEHSEFDVEMEGELRTVRLMTEQVWLDKTFTHVGISAWVTSLARIHVHKLMWPIRKQIYYTDTDSMFTTKKMKTGDKLGELKEEYKCKRAVFLLPKTYVVDDDNDFKKLAMKGFDKRKIEKFEYEDFFTALEGDLRNMKIVRDARMAKFKTGAKKGDLTTLLPKEPRAIKSLYDKRIVTKVGKKWDSKPRHLEMDH